MWIWGVPPRRFRCHTKEQSSGWGYRVRRLLWGGFTGWAYLIAGLMTVDALLLALWAIDEDWPNSWRKKP
ncbi:hypothetical protein QFZ70_000182 [Arthrobacter sp. V1I9]|nr:hypothetical protein [Arthrobacter sp. V1I9]